MRQGPPASFQVGRGVVTIVIVVVITMTIVHRSSLLPEPRFFQFGFDKGQGFVRVFRFAVPTVEGGFHVAGPGFRIFLGRFGTDQPLRLTGQRRLRFDQLVFQERHLALPFRQLGPQLFVDRFLTGSGRFYINLRKKTIKTTTKPNGEVKVFVRSFVRSLHDISCIHWMDGNSLIYPQTHLMPSVHSPVLLRANANSQCTRCNLSAALPIPFVRSYSPHPHPLYSV